MIERWLPIPGFEGLYEVSDAGRIRSNDRWINSSRGFGKQFCRGKIRKPQPRNGYLSAMLYKNGEYKTIYLQSLVLTVFIGPRPKGMQACHGPDPDRKNCRLSNLRWDTVSNNQKDRLVQGGRDYRGAGNGMARLIDGDITRIRDLFRNGVSTEDISSWVGTGRQNVRLIVCRDAWRHVT